jgi:cytochrome c
VPDHFTLSDANIAQVQARMPNRNGMTIDHGLWPGKGLGNGGRPDVKAVACMSNCATEPTVASYLPDHARNAHGNLAEQTRAVGAVHLADTTRPPGTAIGAATAADAARPADPFAAAVVLARKANCLTCHAVDNKVVGPALRDVGAKYAGRADAVDYMAGRIIAGSSGVWGPVPMPANAVSPAEAKALAEWIATGLKK